MSVKALPPGELCAEGSLGTLRVRFFRAGDRYSHAIDLIDRDETRTLLESVEGDDAEIWPPSPPMQHLNVSRIVSDTEQRHVAMLVGGAGSSHWSMCVAVSDSENNSREARYGAFSMELLFEVACRTQKPPVWLGNTYRILAVPAAASEELNCACIPKAPPRCLVQTTAVKLRMDTTGESVPLLRIRAADADVKEFDLPMTVRWRYKMRLIGSQMEEPEDHRWLLNCSG
jgi:hypothetical protein